MKQIEQYVDQIDNVEGRSQVHNILMHFQAECFDHAAGLSDEFGSCKPGPLAIIATSAVIADALRQHARAVCPGYQCQSERPVSISSPSNEVEKSDKPPVETVLAEGVVRAGEHVTLNLATGEVKTKPIEADYVPESPESST